MLTEIPTANRVSRTRSLWPYAVIVLLYAVCALLIDPRGEFPLNDDWSYTRSAFRLAMEGQMRVDEWSAPILVGQALYGGLLAWLFGARFLVLRLSTLALSCAASCMLWALLRKLRVVPELAWISVFSWVFNPVWLCLSFTFMTEIPFLFSAILGSCLFVDYLRSDRKWIGLACGLATGYALLIRQTAVLFMVPMAVVILFADEKRKLATRISRALLWSGGVGLVMVPYALWFLAHGGSTPATQRKFELLSRITSRQLIGNSYGLAFYLSFFLLPVLIFLLPALARSMRTWARHSVLMATASWALIAGYGFWWFRTSCSAPVYLPSRSLHSRMPYLLNVLYDTGLGPITLDPTYYGTPPTPTHADAWFVVTVLVALAFASLGIMLVPGIRRVQGGQPDRRILLFGLLAAAGVASFEVVFSHLQEGGLFDRHILTAALPLLLVFGCTWGQNDPGHKPSRGSRAIALSIIAVAAWFSVCGTHDYLAWNRARWELGNILLAAKVDPLTISGGFEFNAWNNYDAFRSRGNIGKIHYWWYDRPDFVIAMELQEDYRILGKREYRSWLHHRDLPVYLLGK